MESNLRVYFTYIYIPSNFVTILREGYLYKFFSLFGI